MQTSTPQPFSLFILVGSLLSCLSLLIVLAFLPSYRSLLLFLLQGATMTIFLCLTASTFAFILGGALSFLSLQNRAMRWIISLSVLWIRGVPLLVLLFFLYFSLGIFSATVSSILALGILYGMYTSEILRAGFLQITQAEKDSARLLGFSSSQKFFFLFLPRCLRNSLPSLFNEMVALLKDSSLASVLAVRELSHLASIAANRDFAYGKSYGLLMLSYIFLSLCISLGAALLEKSFLPQGKGDR